MLDVRKTDKTYQHTNHKKKNGNSITKNKIKKSAKLATFSRRLIYN